METNKKAAPSPVKVPTGKRMKSSPDSESMADAISLALAKQQNTLEEAVRNAVHIAMKDETQCIQSLTAEFQSQMAVVRGLIDTVDYVQHETRGLKHVVSCKSDVSKLQIKMAELEDRERRNNIRIVGLSP